MKKITEKTRIKVSRKINKEFGYSYWDMRSLKGKMREFEMEMTSKRMGVVYFRPFCEKKLMLFGIQYADYLLSK
jgi:hypothetical protein